METAQHCRRLSSEWGEAPPPLQLKTETLSRAALGTLRKRELGGHKNGALWELWGHLQMFLL